MLGLNEIALIRLIHEARLLKPDFTVGELGNQVACDVERATAAARSLFGFGPEFVATHASSIYAALGCPRYESFEPTGGVNAHPFDVTKSLVTAYGFSVEYDLVTNFAVTPRFTDQRAAFATIHALTVPGGLMAHVLPIAQEGPGGRQGPAFFVALAMANGYVVEALRFASGGHLGSYPPLLDAQDAAIAVVLRKRANADFSFPTASEVAAVQSREDGFPGAEQGVKPISPASSGPWDGFDDPFDYHRHQAVLHLAKAVAAVYGYDTDGDIAEFGTQTGTTAVGLARAIAACDEKLRYSVEMHGQAPRKLWLFDSFKGLPAIEENSVDAESDHVRDGIWSEGALTGLDANQLLKAVGAHLPPERIEIREGWFRDTVPAIDPSCRFALLHIDGDLYSSAMNVMDSLFARGMVARGAYVLFDDWNCNRADPNHGERRAWRELVERYAIDASDEGSYGIFARLFVVHDYKAFGSSPQILEPPADRPFEAVPDARSTLPEEAGEILAAPVEPTSTDVYDHQSAAKHFNETTDGIDMDAGFAPIYERCRHYSMTSRERLYAVYKAVEYIQAARLEGTVVECGVWRGGSMMVAAEALRLFPGPRREFHLFDTFEGLPEPQETDTDLWGNDSRLWWEQKKKSERSSDWARSHIDEVRANMASTGIDDECIRYVKGMVEDTIPSNAPEKIALLRLDTDWYSSTRHEMEHLFPRIVPNGVLIIDDYGHFSGARKAVDEYLMATRIPLMLMRIDYTGRIAIKTHSVAVA